MSDLTDYAEGQIRGWMSQGTDPDTAPTNLHVALHTSDPGESPDGSTEVSAGDYSRQSTTTGSGWDTPNENDFENANEISFGTATSDWGDVSHVSLWNGDTTSDNCLAAFALDATVTVNTDDEIRFPAGELSFTLD